MRILFLTHRLPYAPNRGDRIRAHHFLRLLGQRFEVHVLSLIHDDEEMGHLDDLRGVVASVEGVRVSSARNLLSALLALPTRKPLTHVLLHSPRVRGAVERRLAAARPDVVVAYCTGMARYAFEPPLTSLPCVLDMVDVDSEKWAALADTTAGPRRWVYRREARVLRDFERLAVARAFETTVVSVRERELLERVSPGCRARVVQNGVDTASLAPQTSPQTEPRVIFCGVFDYEPNESGALWLAREVWPLVRRLIPAARVDLVGMNPSRAVRALEEELSIHVTGAVPDVRPHLWNAAIAVAPVWMSRGVQNKVLEAVAAGLPCVVTPPVFEGLPENVRPACVVGADPGAFADAVVSLLRETPEARRLRAGRADLSSLSWSTQASLLADVISAAGGAADGRKG